MEFFLLMLLLPVPPLVFRADDPAPGVWQTRSDARNLECERLSEAEAHSRSPERVPEPAARIYQDTPGALVCQRRWMKENERDARDEAVLSELSRSVATLAQAARARVDAQRLIHVDAFHPSVQVAAKVAVAMRTALAESGRRVSDRVPLLAAGDLAVLGRMPPEQAYPLACRRYFAEQSLGTGDVFVGVMVLDARETQLHAGYCDGGVWRWLQ